MRPGNLRGRRLAYRPRPRFCAAFTFFWYAFAKAVCEGRRITHVFFSNGAPHVRTMELALNLAWALIAAASYVLLFRRLAIPRFGHGHGPRRWQCIVALTCALLILFPVISLTDDLHEIQATAEEAAASVVIKRCVGSHESPPARTIQQIPYLFAAVSTHFAWTVVGAAAVLESAFLRPVLQQPAPGRAPPVLSASFLVG